MSAWVLVLALLVAGCSYLPIAVQRTIGVAPRAGAEYFAAPTGGGTACTAGSPCTIQTGLGKLSAGDTLTLQDGTYQGASQMLNLASFAPGVSGTAGGSGACGSNGVACTPITVRAQNDGAVFINGQGSNRPFILEGHSYWTFQGFDAGNSGGCGSGCDNAMAINGAGSSSTGLRFQRVIGFNAATGNNHVWTWGNCVNCLFEDIGGFGVGRDIMVENNNRSGSVVRRAWFRWDGIDPPQGAAGPIQTCYECTGVMTYENIITVWGVNLQAGLGASTNSEKYPAMVHRQNTTLPYPADVWAGMISYGSGNINQNTGGAWVHIAGMQSGISFKDWFVDTTGPQQTGYGAFYLGGGGVADRLTAIRLPGQPSLTNSWSTTNVNECTSLSACPNLYTGASPGTGSRACFRYANGTLTSTPLWPWPMDDRIKTALSRAGATALTGSGSTGYAANTVTSEIASRYGGPPAQCLGVAFVPSFPLAGDFPSTGVLDDYNRGASGTLGPNWTTSMGSPFTGNGTQAVAPATWSGQIWNASSFLGLGHEVHALWPTMGTAAMGLVFAAQSSTSPNNQYRLFINRPAGANASVEIGKIDGAGGYSLKLGPIDLGTNVDTPTHGFGVRVDTTGTMIVYWKWTDGNWYRVGSVLDATLPTGAVYGGLLGASPAVNDSFGGGTCCGAGAAPAPGNVGRFGSIFPKAP